MRIEFTSVKRTRRCSWEILLSTFIAPESCSSRVWLVKPSLDKLGFLLNLKKEEACFLPGPVDVQVVDVLQGAWHDKVRYHLQLPEHGVDDDGDEKVWHVEKVKSSDYDWNSPSLNIKFHHHWVGTVFCQPETWNIWLKSYPMIFPFTPPPSCSDNSVDEVCNSDLIHLIIKLLTST